MKKKINVIGTNQFNPKERFFGQVLNQKESFLRVKVTQIICIFLDVWNTKISSPTNLL